MLSRRAVLAGAGALPFAASARAAGAPAPSSLREIAAAHGLRYGCAVAGYELGQRDFMRVLLGEAGALVAEYEMKRKTVEPMPGRYYFEPGDALVDFAHDHDMSFRGHPLLWHRSNPAWLEDTVRSTRKETFFTAYIAAMVGRYRGRVRSWDVVNEILAPDDGRADGLRNSFWLDVFGPSYIDTAFHAARDADPQAQLVYNDWGCELAGPEHDRFRADTLKFLEGARARGVPIDALGLQGHLRAYGQPVDRTALRVFLDRVHALGFRVLVTEHDVGDMGGPSAVAARDRAAGEASARFLDVAAPHPATDAVLTWGLSDRFLDSAGARMLPLDRKLRRKPMWHAIARAFEART
jgi:endo-1,4-beta-xylanase